MKRGFLLLAMIAYATWMCGPGYAVLPNAGSEPGSSKSHEQPPPEPSSKGTPGTPARIENNLPEMGRPNENRFDSQESRQSGKGGPASRVKVPPKPHPGLTHPRTAPNGQEYLRRGEGSGNHPKIASGPLLEPYAPSPRLTSDVPKAGWTENKTALQRSTPARPIGINPPVNLSLNNRPNRAPGTGIIGGVVNPNKSTASIGGAAAKHKP